MSDADTDIVETDSVDMSPLIEKDDERSSRNSDSNEVKEERRKQEVS